MALTLTATFGIIFGWAIARWAGICIPCAISGVDLFYRANRSYPFRSRGAGYSDWWRSIFGLTLLIAVVAIGTTDLQSQTETPAKSPSSAEAYLMRGETFSGNQQYDRAIADYTRAIELRPNYPKAYNSRGVAYMQGGYGVAKSVPDFDRAIGLKPDFRYAYINRANARLLAHPLLALQDFHRAGMHPERALAVVAFVCLLFALAITLLVLRRRRFRELETSHRG
jgi:tetratricopeptide (TPR) repeat protein